MPDLPELTDLRLEGTIAGREFGDACLAHLMRYPNLQTLMLFGQNFTNKGLAQLTSFPELHSVYLQDTSITADAIKSAKSQRSNMNVELQLPQWRIEN